MTKKGFIFSILSVLLRVYSHAQSDPAQIPGLEMWLKADAGIVLNGNYVAEWNDQSGNNHHATSPFDVIRPVLQTESLNNLPAVSFDGVEDFLSFSDVNNLRTAFWVMRESPDASGWPLRPLLGYSAGLPFMRGPGEEIYDPSFSASEVRNGITRLNFQPINGITTVMPVTYSILSLVTTGPVTVNTLTMELGIYGRTWWGEMAEVIIYNTALTSDEVLQVETYLAEKYVPSFLAMEDVSVPYGFCEATLCASPGFLTYQWQDGPQTACRTVNAPGEYVVTLTDIFGRILNDTVSVNYPGNPAPSSLNICSGTEYIWDTGLSDAEYDFLWDDNSTGSSRTINASGNYSVAITDTNGCSTTFETTVSVDDFAQSFSLGEDSSICAGNSLELEPLPLSDVSYLWNTSAQTAQIAITESGLYWLEATNANGCVLRDTVDITIAGIAPELDVSLPVFCSSISTQVAVSVVSGDPVIGWTWDMGDGNLVFENNFSYSYNEPGEYEITLTAQGQGGCSAYFSSSINVNASPVAAIQFSTPSVNVAALFSDISIAGDAPISNYAWNINGDDFTGSTAEYTFTQNGYFPLSLEVTDDNGCSSIELVNVYVPFDITAITGLEMWLKADAGIVLNGNYVAEWNDQSGNNHHATSPFDVIRPVLQTESLNNLPAVSFDGVEDFLSFSDVSNLRTAFWVMRESPDASGSPLRPLLGYSAGLPFMRGPGEEIYDPSFSASEVRNGITRLNFQPINGITTVMPVTYSILSLVTTGPVTVNTLTMELGIYGRTWWGEMAEVIIYNTALTSDEVLQVETYLAEKYGPSFLAMEDVSVPYGFCETTLCASPGFLTYQWQDGPQTQCRTVSAPGDYIVTLTDTFGRVIHDTVSVNYPGNVQPGNVTICSGETYTWDTQLDDAEYNFLWDDNSTGSFREISTAGSYSVTISDDNACSTTGSIEVTVDNFAQEFSLGGDAELCSGNSIDLEPSPENVIGYQWSTSEQTPEILITESGSYWVEAVNNNNCILRDTAIIAIIGVAPQISFSAEGLCEDGTTIFEATLLTAGIASSWNWSFGDTQIGSGSTIAHSYDVSGDFMVQLSVTTTDGCSNFLEQPVHVFQKPIPSFTVDQQCQNLPLTFTENSQPGEATVTSYNWTINGNFYSGTDVTVSFDEPGFYPLLLETTDANNCVSGISGFVEVKPVPEIDFSVNGNCEGSLAQFYENIDENAVGGIDSYAWDFGDETGSLLPNPTHFYSTPDNYLVKLAAAGVNGCVADSTIEITVYEKPQPDFVISNACLGAAYQFNETSESLDVIVTWNWLVGNETSYNTQNPLVVFDQTGLVPIQLQVITEHGCENSIEQQIPVWAPPVASYEYSPEIGEAPFEVQFVLTTPDAVRAHWYFGDTQESEELNPVHIFTLNGTAYTQVVVYNDAGCTDTTGTIITIAAPLYDIALRDVQWIATDGTADMQATVMNTGNIVISEILFTWQIGNDAPVMEEWTGQLLPGESMIYPFVSKPNFIGSQFPYICVTAETSPLTYNETNLTDNQICRPTASTGLEVFPPYPNPGDDRMFIRFITPLEGDLIIRAYDAKGNAVVEIEDDAVPKGFHQYFVDISMLSDGNYKLILQMNDYTGVVSFMKKKKQ